MPTNTVTIFYVTMTAKVTVVIDDAEAALNLAKEAIKNGQAETTWTQAKDKVVVVTPQP